MAKTAYRFDFENGTAEGLILDGARLTSDPSEVVSGSWSVAANTMDSTGEWHEFIHTGPEVRFQPGNTYRVSFDFKVLDRGPEGERHKRPQFYTMLRSLSEGPSDAVDQYGPFWRLGTGTVSTVDTVYEIGEVSDYYLIIGIRRQAALAVDNIEIATCTLTAPGDWERVRVMPYAEDKALEQLQAERKRSGSERLVNGLVNVTTLRMGLLTPEERAAIVEELRLDLLNWVPFLPIRQVSSGLDFGIRTATSKIEYQEHYQVEEPELWPQRFEKLWNGGFSISIHGTPIQDEMWAAGGWYTCHNGKVWREEYLRSLEWAAEYYEGLCQDNIACAPFNKGGGCFCRDCETLFREYLLERYSPEELAAWEIEDLETFSARKRIVTTGRMGTEALADPIVREYIKFQYITHRDRWRDYAIHVKDLARKRGTSFFPVLGNQIGLQGFWPFAVTLSPYNDAIEIEHIGNVTEILSEEGFLYKLGLASGYHEKPVWARGVFLDERTRRPSESPAFWRFLFGDAIANGARHTYHLFRVDQRQFDMIGGDTEPYRVDFRANPNLYSVFRDFAEFSDSNRALLASRESLARVAVVYSLPSAMWRQFMPLGLEAWEVAGEFREVAEELNRRHIPFDAIVFGHPELWDDRPVLENLSRYRAIVLPLADCLTDKQVEALIDFSNRGGLILRDGNLGDYDENRNLRDQGRLIQRNARYWREEGTWEELAARAGFGLNAPDTLFAHPWYSPDASVVGIHFSNHAVDPHEDTVTPAVIESLTLELDRPLGKMGVRWLVPGSPRRVPTLRVVPDPIAARAGRYRIQLRDLPSVDSYAILVLGDTDALDAANREAGAFREKDREEVREATRKRLGITEPREETEP